MSTRKPRIAVVAGPTATILNTPPLVAGPLRPQRLGAATTVWVEHLSAHPMESDLGARQAGPDGYLTEDGSVSPERTAETDVAVVAVRLDAGALYPLPYTPRPADGWEPGGWDDPRQTFFPDASRAYEEIDALVEMDGRDGTLSALADFVHVRVLPSAGRTSPPDCERLGHDYFPYWPPHRRGEPDRGALARLTNELGALLAGGEVDAVQYLEGSASIEESLYWLALTLDTDRPVVGHCAQVPHQALGSDGPRNIVDGVLYVASGAALDEDGRDRVGPVLVADGQVFAAREVAKTDGRYGGYRATGGLGGVVGAVHSYRGVHVDHLSTRRHTRTSELTVARLPAQVRHVHGRLATGLRVGTTTVKDAAGRLREDAVPSVLVHKYGRYTGDAGTDSARERAALWGWIEAYLDGATRPLGIVLEGNPSYGHADPWEEAVLTTALHAGVPVVRAGRGNGSGFVRIPPMPFAAASNLTAAKARILLTAALLKLGSLEPAADPRNPTEAERQRTADQLAAYQELFDEH
ncbi:MAG: asparaginase [Nocardioidaceae bacterium]|nr:asparaginase [Nocardioidaceae bacterium]